MEQETAPAPTSGFREAAFLFAILLILGAWKFGVEGLME